LTSHTAIYTLSLHDALPICGASELFAEMLASNPALSTTLVAETKPRADERDYRALLRAQIDREKSFAAELTALRRAWARLLLEIDRKSTRLNSSHSQISYAV